MDPKVKVTVAAIAFGILVFLVVLIWTRFLSSSRRSFSIRHRPRRRPGQEFTGFGDYYRSITGDDRTVTPSGRGGEFTAGHADPDQQAYLAWKLSQIDDRVRRLEQASEKGNLQQEQRIQHLVKQVDTLEAMIQGQDALREDQLFGYAPASAPSGRYLGQQDWNRHADSVLASPDLEKLAFEILGLIEPAGRAAPLARLPQLIEWLTNNHSGIEAEAIGELNRDLWLLLVLTADGNTGVVVPALDSIIGPGEILRWFEGGRYDGTQTLVRANIWSLGKAAREVETRAWQPSVKGRIDLT